MKRTAYLSLASLPKTLKIDWISIGHQKNLDMTGKQNYQKLGVEAELNF